MPSEDTKINHYEKSDKAPYIIYADLGCLIEKIDGCKTNLENPSTTKVSEHLKSSFQSIENSHTGVNISWKNFLNSYESKQ